MQSGSGHCHDELWCPFHQRNWTRRCVSLMKTRWNWHAPQSATSLIGKYLITPLRWLYDQPLFRSKCNLINVGIVVNMSRYGIYDFLVIRSDQNVFGFWIKTTFFPWYHNAGAFLICSDQFTSSMRLQMPWCQMGARTPGTAMMIRLIRHDDSAWQFIEQNLIGIATNFAPLQY